MLFLWVVSLGKSVRVYKIHSISFMLCLFLHERQAFCVLTESPLHINKSVEIYSLSVSIGGDRYAGTCD